MKFAKNDTGDLFNTEEALTMCKSIADSALCDQRFFDDAMEDLGVDERILEELQNWIDCNR